VSHGKVRRCPANPSGYPGFVADWGQRYDTQPAPTDATQPSRGVYLANGVSGVIG